MKEVSNRVSPAGNQGCMRRASHGYHNILVTSVGPSGYNADTLCTVDHTKLTNVDMVKDFLIWKDYAEESKPSLLPRAYN